MRGIRGASLAADPPAPASTDAAASVVGEDDQPPPYHARSAADPAPPRARGAPPSSPPSASPPPPPAPAPRLPLSFSHFDVLGELGDGSFSEVLRARRRATGEVFALKVMPKRQILRHDAKARFVRDERAALDLCADVPGVVRLRFTFQDADALYMGLDVMENGELFDQIRLRRERVGADGAKRSGLSLAATRFYLRELVDVLRAAHARGVVHRDVKPENVLINRRGHVELVDFGSCLILPESRRSRDEEEGEGGALPAEGEDEACCSSDAKEIRRRKAALAFVGTCDYVPPEVLGEPGGDEKGLADDLSRPAPSPFALDHWALGCVAFQALCGKPPFRRANEFLTYAAVQGGDAPAWPEDFVDRKAREEEEEEAAVCLSLLPEEERPSRGGGGEAPPPRRRRYPAISSAAEARRVAAAAVDFVERLLARDPSERLGGEAGDIEAHPFLDAFGGASPEDVRAMVAPEVLSGGGEEGEDPDPGGEEAGRAATFDSGSEGYGDDSDAG